MTENDGTANRPVPRHVLPLTDLGPLVTTDDAKRWCELVGRWSAGGEIHPEVALAALRRVREWRQRA